MPELHIVHAGDVVDGPAEGGGVLMEISKLRSRITIQQAVVQKDTIGNHGR